LTGFTITDAIELEDEESPIPEELLLKILRFGPLIPAKRLFEESDSQYDISPVIPSISMSYFSGEMLVLVLVNVLMRWTIGSQPIPVDGHMHELIDLGVGHLKTVHSEEFDPDINHPVYISKPLVILSQFNFRKADMDEEKLVGVPLYEHRSYQVGLRGCF